jgi:hypothetical protein
MARDGDGDDLVSFDAQGRLLTWWDGGTWRVCTCPEKEVDSHILV